MFRLVLHTCIQMFATSERKATLRATLFILDSFWGSDYISFMCMSCCCCWPNICLMILYMYEHEYVYLQSASRHSRIYVKHNAAVDKSKSRKKKTFHFENGTEYYILLCTQIWEQMYNECISKYCICYPHTGDSMRKTKKRNF